MLYSIFRVLMRSAFRCYFRNITFNGVERIPATGPVMFLCNHPSSFTEPMLLACFQPRVLNFLVRGDIYENRFLKPLLEFTHQIPIYRARDGFENLRKNKGTFERVYQKLSANECVLIFPESTTQMVRYLRPLQKGAAHMCLASVREHGLSGLVVIPCGVNFTDVLKVGSDVVVNFGEPIAVGEWLDEQDPSADLPARLTEKFTREMDQVVYSVPGKISPAFYDQISAMYQKEDGQAARLARHRALISAMTTQSEAVTEVFSNYTSPHSRIEINEEIVRNDFSGRFMRWIALGLCALCGWPAAFFYSIPLVFSRKMAFHLVKNEFRAPIRMVIAILMILFFDLAAGAYLWHEFGFPVAVPAIFMLWFSFKAYLTFHFNRHLMSPAMVLTHGNARNKMMKDREAAIRFIDGFLTDQKQ